MHKKMDMLLKLKSDIQANRVSLDVKMPSYRGVAVFSFTLNLISLPWEKILLLSHIRRLRDTTMLRKYKISKVFINKHLKACIVYEY